MSDQSLITPSNSNGEQSVSLILDACAIKNLASVKIGNSSSWLDLVLKTAELPTINSIIIPAILEWELRGGLTLADQSGKLSFIRIDEQFANPLYRKNSADKESAALFAQAFQWRPVNGVYQLINGKNPKIIVVETEEQTALLKEIYDIHLRNDPDKLRQLDEFRRNNAGEEAAEYIAQNAPLKGSAVIITNDITYLAQRNQQATTMAGYPISTAKVLEYVRAEFEARGANLATELGVRGYKQYREAIVATWTTPHASDLVRNVYKPTGEGMYITTEGVSVRAEPLQETFKRGAAMLKGELPAYNYPTPIKITKAERGISVVKQQLDAEPDSKTQEPQIDIERIAQFIPISEMLSPPKPQVAASNYFAHDPRNFRQMMLEWDIYSRKGDTGLFLEYVGLTNTEETAGEFDDILRGTAAPSKELTAHLSSYLPLEIASKQAFNLAAENARRLLEKHVDIQSSKLTKYSELSFPLVETTKQEALGSAFYIKLQQRLQEIMAQAGLPYDEKQATCDLAASLGVDPWVLQGFMPVPSYITKESLATCLVQALYSGHEEYSSFGSKALEFFDSCKGIAIESASQYGIEKTAGEIIYLLRQNAKISATRLAEIAPITKTQPSLDVSKVYQIEKGNCGIRDEVAIFALLRGLSVNPVTAKSIAAKVWVEHDKEWQARTNSAQTPNEEFRILRELSHISRYELALALLDSGNIPPSTNISSVVDKIATFEAETTATEVQIELFNQALKEAVVTRAENFNVVAINFKPTSEVIKDRRKAQGLNQDKLAAKIVDLCHDKLFWNNLSTVKNLISSYESGKPLPQDIEKLEALAQALGYEKQHYVEFFNACNARHKAFWEKVLEEAKNPNDIFRATRHLSFPLQSLSEFVAANWNEESGVLWGSLSGFKKAVMQFEDFGIPPKTDAQLHFLVMAGNISKQPEEVERFAAKCRVKYVSYWEKQYSEAANFGQALHALRKLNYMTLQNLGDAIGEVSSSPVAVATILSWENNNNKPQKENFELLCNVFEVRGMDSDRFHKLWLAPVQDTEEAKKFADQQSIIYDRYGRELEARLRAHMEVETVLRPPQRRMNYELLSHFSQGKGATHGIRPTGTGKTVTFGSEIVAFNTPVGSSEPAWDMPTLVLVPRKLLADQNADDFISKLGISREKIGIYHSDMGKKAKTKALSAPVLVTTYDSARKGGIDLSKYKVVILDEVHTAKGELTIPMVQELCTNALVLGFTATDTFVIKGAYKNIGQFLFAGNEPFHKTGFRDAVLGSEIAPTKNFVYEANTDIDLPDSGGEDFSEKERAKVVAIEGRDEAIIEAFAVAKDNETGEVLRDMISVWYHEGITAAKDFAGKLNKVFGEGYAVAVWGDMPKAERKTILARQEAGEIMAIVNADLLGLGWNSPKTRVCGIVKPCKSPSAMEQMGGRAARLDPDNPDKISYVLNFLDKDLKKSLTFAQVVDGANILPSSFRARINKKKDAPAEHHAMPKHEPKLKLATKIIVKAYYTIREIVGFLDKRMSEERANRVEKLPEDKRHWIPIGKVFEELNIYHNTKSADVVLALYGFWQNNSHIPVVIGESTFRVDEIFGVYSRNGNLIQYLNPEALPIVQEVLHKSRKPLDKSNWVTGLKACKLLGLPNNPESYKNIQAACRRLMEKKEKFVIPQLISREESKGEYFAHEIIAEITKNGDTKIYFEPRAKELVLAEIGVKKGELGSPPSLPMAKFDWYTVSHVCRVLRLHIPGGEAADLNRIAIKSIFEKLLADSKACIGSYKATEVIGIYSQHGHTHLYVDPKLINEKLLTRSMVEAEVKILKENASTNFGLPEFSIRADLLSGNTSKFFAIQRLYSDLEVQIPAGHPVGEVFLANYSTAKQIHPIKIKFDTHAESGENCLYAETAIAMQILADMERSQNVRRKRAAANTGRE